MPTRNALMVGLVSLGLVLMLGRGTVSSTSTVAQATAPAAVPSPVPSGTASARETSAGGVAADPNYEQALKEGRLRTSGWKTDFRFHTVAFNEIFSGGVPRDGIPPLDNPKFTSVAKADKWLDKSEPVLSLEVGGEARAYPLQILIWHEIVNDEVGGTPVTATFCPLCNSAVVFDRRLDGVVHDFGVSGNLRNSDLIMGDVPLTVEN